VLTDALILRVLKFNFNCGWKAMCKISTTSTTQLANSLKMADSYGRNMSEQYSITMKALCNKLVTVLFMYDKTVCCHVLFNSPLQPLDPVQCELVTLRAGDIVKW
jgi:hypothetical protein